MGKGQELYKKAKRLIPGGTMLLSKRPEMFYRINGRLISARRKDVRYGIWTVKNILTCLLWE